MNLNLSVIEGEVETRETLRFTPAGLPVFSFELKHVSTQNEAGQERIVDMILPVLAIGDLAKEMHGLPEKAHIRVKGFLAHRSVKNRSVVLHATAYQTELES